MQREGVFREMKRRRVYEKPSEQAAREKSEAVRRLRKLARKQAVREGLIAAPKKITFIDREPPISNTFFACFTNGCMADYGATPEQTSDPRRRFQLSDTRPADREASFRRRPITRSRAILCKLDEWRQRAVARVLAGPRLSCPTRASILSQSGRPPRPGRTTLHGRSQKPSA
jgi:small subunit ribosomal protein S21